MTNNKDWIERLKFGDRVKFVRPDHETIFAVVVANNHLQVVTIAAKDRTLVEPYEEICYHKHTGVITLPQWFAWEMLPAPGTWSFTQDELTELLHDTVSMFIEYRYIHEFPAETAEYKAVGEIMDGLQAEREMKESGEL